MTRRPILTTILIGLAAFLAPHELYATAAQDTRSPPVLRLPTGPHAVGLRVENLRDRSRTWLPRIDELGRPETRDRSRPIQVLIWYPASAGGASTMRVGDYLDLLAGEFEPGKVKAPPMLIDNRRRMAQSLSQVLAARREAPAAPGRYPLVVYSPGLGGAAWENADLCEYLASHGYVVIAAPSSGFAGREFAPDLTGAIGQARDVRFLIDFGEALPNVDPGRIAVIGTSWGGLASMIAAASDDRVAALVSLDGSARYFPHLLAAAGVDPARMSVPLLAFLQRNASLELQDNLLAARGEASSPLTRWGGALTTVHMMRLAHEMFLSRIIRDEERWWGVARLRPMEQGDFGVEDWLLISTES